MIGYKNFNERLIISLIRLSKWTSSSSYELSNPLCWFEFHFIIHKVILFIFFLFRRHFILFFLYHHWEQHADSRYSDHAESERERYSSICVSYPVPKPRGEFRPAAFNIYPLRCCAVVSSWRSQLLSNENKNQNDASINTFFLIHRFAWN